MDHRRSTRAKLVATLMATVAVGCAKTDRADNDAPPESAGFRGAPAVDPAVSAVSLLPAEFGDTWYQGKAEVNRFELSQARYGELRNGDAVLIFVTEDFLVEPHVKLESAAEGRETATVLKMNMAKKFLTGIYPYSMMTSVFTPIQRAEYPHTLKVTSSSQEWCGHTFTQLNRQEQGYRVRLFSYFEREGDRDYRIDPDLLEDEVWTRIRLAPDDLPTGEISVLPGTMAERLMHTPGVPKLAEASFSVPEGTPGIRRYTLTYGEPDRVLAIDFRQEFPHEIEQWTETSIQRGVSLTTTARRTHSTWIDYWSRNSTADTSLRRLLGLD